MNPEALPQPPDALPHQPIAAGHHERLVGDYAAPSRYEREKHAEDVAALEAEIHALEARLHEMARMSLLGKLGAMLAGRPEDGALEELYKRLHHLKEDPRFREEGRVH